jgi:hypothetical protein
LRTGIFEAQENTPQGAARRCRKLRHMRSPEDYARFLPIVKRILAVHARFPFVAPMSRIGSVNLL